MDGYTGGTGAASLSRAGLAERARSRAVIRCALALRGRRRLRRERTPHLFNFECTPSAAEDGLAEAPRRRSHKLVVSAGRAGARRRSRRVSRRGGRPCAASVNASANRRVTPPNERTPRCGRCGGSRLRRRRRPTKVEARRRIDARWTSCARRGGGRASRRRARWVRVLRVQREGAGRVSTALGQGRAARRTAARCASGQLRRRRLRRPPPASRGRRLRASSRARRRGAW